MCSDRHTSQSSRCIYYLNPNYCFKTITQGLASSHYMLSRQFGFLLTGKAAFCSTCYNDSNGRQQPHLHCFKKTPKGTEAIQLLHCLYFSVSQAGGASLSHKVLVNQQTAHLDE